MARVTKAVVNEWWGNCGFWEIEKISGFRMIDFDPEDGYQEFVEVCDEWWDKLSFREKKELYIRWNFNDHFVKKLAESLQE